MSKALFYLLTSALDFYNKLCSNLEGNGSEINPYDPCVANKMINGKQMTVILHVDNLKVLHVGKNENTKFAELMMTIYGEKLTVHSRGLNTKVLEAKIVTLRNS